MCKIPLAVVAGATASGKTRLAISIAKAFGGEIVSADSMQIYKYMDIGTAKPTAAERAEAGHRLIDFVEPDEEFSVADYTPLAHREIADIAAGGGLPVLCGGTGLYINSVVDDITFGEVETDYALRAELKAKAERDGGEALLKILAEFDPVSAARLHPNNTRRIIRAIEFYKTTGMPISEHQEQTRQNESRYAPLMLAIDYPREVLYDRINRRVDMMFDEGLIDEVRRLCDMGYKKSLNSMKAIGYKELIEYFEGKCTLDAARDAIKQGSRRYAKRQLTWFRRDKRIIMLEPDTAEERAIEIINKRKHLLRY